MAATNSYDDLVELHRKEKKDLMAKIQKMKHSVPNSDKKKKKEMAAEISQMLADFDLKREEELKNYEAQHENSKESTVETPVDVQENTDELEAIENETSAEPTTSSQKISKAQKRRNKKAMQQKERAKAIADQEVDNLTGLRHLEIMKIKQKLSERGLTIFEIPSDGNCLYKAIEHQLSVLNLKKLTVDTLRQETSKYLLQHKDEYLPFLTHPETGDILSETQFEKYCDDIENTPAWGGHVEIQILSSVCGNPIEVIQADGPSLIVGDEKIEPKLIISYHRHVYGLGEHYNSVIPENKETEENVNNTG